MKVWRWLPLLWVCFGYAHAQSTGGITLSSVSREFFPEDSVQLYRTTYHLLLGGSGKIRHINSIRVEDWTLEFDKLGKRIRIKKGKPLPLVVNCMENRRAKRTEWMITSWYGSHDDATNLYIIRSERMKNGHTGLPDIEIVCTTPSGKATLTATLPIPAAHSPR